jgi:large subunit ribosomal protein L9
MGMLFGSVTARDVAEAAETAGQPLARTQVQIDAPIKALGLYPVKIKLHPEVTVKVTVNIARSQEEAKIQLEKGAAVKKAAEERAEVEAAFGAPVTEATEEGAEAEANKPAKKAKKADKAEAAEGEAEEAPKAKKPRGIISAALRLRNRPSQEGRFFICRTNSSRRSRAVRRGGCVRR